MKKIFLMFVLILFLPSGAKATTWDYAVEGTLENTDADHQTFSVSGNILIDDQFRTWNGGFAPPAPSDLINGQFSYFISGYDLNVDDYCFSGDYGTFYVERSDSWVGDLMWFLEDGSGAWNTWTGEHFYFYHEDMSPYDLFNELDNLAPIIRLTSLDYFFDDPILTDWVTTDILLTRTNPVPEPSTILLLGFGLAGLAGLRKGRRVE